MSADAARVFEDALSLPSDARASLIEELLRSLNLPASSEIERLWAEEAERRVEQIDRGEVELLDGEEVFRELRQKHQR
jgi:hypothetical protein